MPIAKVQLPDGRIARFEVPEGTTQEQVMAFVQTQFKPETEQETFDPTEGMGVGEKVAAGAGSAIVGAGQGLKQASAELGSNISARDFLINPFTAPFKGLYRNLTDRQVQSPMVSQEQLQQIQADVDERKRLDAPLMDTTSGKVGNIAGNVALTLPTMAIPGVNTYAGASLMGGALGASQPTATGESRTLNTVVGAGGGAAGKFASDTLASILRTGYGVVEPLFSKGRERIAASAVARAAGDKVDEVIQRMASARQLVPGSQPTAAEVSQSGGIAALQRGMAANAPQDFSERAIEQNAARISALRNISGTSDDLVAAKAARSKATAPLYKKVSESTAEADPGRTVNLIDRVIKSNPARKQLVNSLNEIRESLFEEYPLTQRASDAWKEVNQTITDAARGVGKVPKKDVEVLGKVRTIMDRARKGTIDVDEALESLKGLKPKSQTALSSLQFAKDTIKTPDFVLRQNPQALKSASNNISDILSKKGPTGEKVNEVIARELTTIKKSLDNQIRKAEPAFGEAQKKFAEMSKPVARMQVGQALTKKIEPALTQGNLPIRQNAEAFARALRDGDQLAAKATGFKRARIEDVLTPDDMSTLSAIRDDLARSVQARDLARGAGSDTVQKLAMTNLLERSGVPMWARKLPPVEMAGSLLSRGGDAVYGGADDQIRGILTQILLDPKYGAALMSQLGPGKTQELARILARPVPALSASTALQD